MKPDASNVLFGLLDLLQKSGTPMRLANNEFRNACPPLYSTASIPKSEKRIVTKFFTPDSNWIWYVIEGEPENGDFMCFGLVRGFEDEWGYFMMSELENAKGPLGLPIESDMAFEYNMKTMGDITQKE